MFQKPRREFLLTSLKSISAALCLLQVPNKALAAKKLDFLRKRFPKQSLSLSNDISLQLPKIISDAKQIPIAIQYNGPRAKQLFLFIENNPSPLLAKFQLYDATWLRTNIKAAKTSWLYVVVQTDDGELLYQKHWLEVNENGCG